MSESDWTLITSMDLSQVPSERAVPPMALPTRNFFANKSLANINSFVRSNEAEMDDLKILTEQWVVIDQEGLGNETCIVMHQDLDEKTMEKLNTFSALRISCSQAHAMMANLDVGNMDFEEWADMGAGVQADGLYKWVGPPKEADPEDVELEKDIEMRREAALKSLRDSGHVD